MTRWAVIGVVLLVMGLLTGCGGNDIGGGQQQPVLEPMDDETSMGALAVLNLLPAADTFISQGAPGVNYEAAPLCTVAVIPGEQACARCSAST